VAWADTSRWICSADSKLALPLQVRSLPDERVEEDRRIPNRIIGPGDALRAPRLGWGYPPLRSPCPFSGPPFCWSWAGGVWRCFGSGGFDAARPGES